LSHDRSARSEQSAQYSSRMLQRVGIKEFLFASRKNMHVAFGIEQLIDGISALKSLAANSAYGSLRSVGRAPPHGVQPHVVLRAATGISALEVPAVLRVAVPIWRTASAVAAPCVRRGHAVAQRGVAPFSDDTKDSVGRSPGRLASRRGFRLFLRRSFPTRAACHDSSGLVHLFIRATRTF